jgi:hypothetical protein
VEVWAADRLGHSLSKAFHQPFFRGQNQQNILMEQAKAGKTGKFPLKSVYRFVT